MKACRGAGELLAWGSRVWKLRRSRRWAGRLNGLPLKAWIETERFWHQVPVQFILQAQASTSTTKLCKLRDRLNLTCLCVWKGFFFLLLAHSARICLQKMVHFTWDNQSFWNDKQSRVPIQYWIIYRSLHTKLVCLSEHLSIYFVPLLNFELDFSQLLVTSQLCLKSWSLMLFHSWNTACRLSWHWWNTEWEGH